MSTGLVTLVADGSAIATITRPGGHSVTVPIGVSTSGGLSPLRYSGDDFTGYANNTALRAQISSTIGGTGDFHTCIYNDGVPGSGPLMSVDTSVLYNGHQTLKLTFNAPSAHPQFYSGFSQWGGTTTMSDFWFRSKVRFSSGFTSAGTNTGASCGFKLHGWGFDGGNGSGRIELTGAYNETNPEYEIYDSCVHYDNSSWLPTTSPNVYSGYITDEWSGTTPWMDYIIHHYTNADGLGTTIKFWRAHDGSTPTLVGTAVTSTSGGQTAPDVYTIQLAMNINQDIQAGGQSINYGFWEVIDGSVHANPYGL